MCFLCSLRFIDNYILLRIIYASFMMFIEGIMSALGGYLKKINVLFIVHFCQDKSSFSEDIKKKNTACIQWVGVKQFLFVVSPRVTLWEIHMSYTKSWQFCCFFFLQFFKY